MMNINEIALSVLNEVKKGETFTKAQAKAYFKKQYGSKFNAKKMDIETDDKGNKYWMDKGHSGEAVPMKEEVELDEGFNLPAMDYNNLPEYKDFQNMKIKDAMKEFSISKPDTKTVQDLILWLNTFSMMWKAKHIK